MSEVTIEIVTSEDFDRGVPVSVTIKREDNSTIDVGHGYIGGEPEDNCIYRTYNWIVPMLKKLGETLGAEVTIIETEEND